MKGKSMGKHITVTQQDGGANGKIHVLTIKTKKLLDTIANPNITQEIGAELFAAQEQMTAGIDRLVLDFKDVEYVSAPMLGKLITLDRKLTAGNEGKVNICNADKIHETFKASRLDKLFNIAGDLDTAIAEVKGGRAIS